MFLRPVGQILSAEDPYLALRKVNVMPGDGYIGFAHRFDLTVTFTYVATEN